MTGSGHLVVSFLMSRKFLFSSESKDDRIRPSSLSFLMSRKFLFSSRDSLSVFLDSHENNIRTKVVQNTVEF